MKSINKKIEIANCSNLSLMDFNCDGDLILVGNFNGICGNESQTNMINIRTIMMTLRNGHTIYVMGDRDTNNYFFNIIKKWNKKLNICNSVYLKKHVKGMDFDKYNMNEIIPEMKRKFKGMGKIKNIIINPPYKGSLHLDFFETCFDNLDKLSGKMIIIEPATWLINVRKNGKTKRYDEIKKKLDNHIQSIVIENLNKEFGTGLYVPFATTTIDMSKEFGTIDFTCCGEHKNISNIYDCNLIGKYNDIWSILNKTLKFGDMMCDHITNEDKGRDYWYAKYAELTPDCGCSNTSDRKGLKYDGDYLWTNTNNGMFNIGYIYSSYHTYKNEISNVPLCAYDRGKHLTYKITDNIYGTKEELENWKHFIFSNKLSLFINIVMTIDQNNNSKEFLPWLVDRKYTDDEINIKFGFTDDEIKLIDTTIKKYERNSPWFKRYMCGPDSVSDDNVHNFIQEISK